MTVTAPPRPPRPSDPVDREEVEALVEALIEEARQRARRRRRIRMAVVACVVLVGATVFAVFERTAESQSSSPALAAGSGLSGAKANGLLAYAGSVGLPPHGHSEIFTVQPDGSHIHQLTHFGYGGGAQLPDWSPDGRKIIFTRYWGDFVDGLAPPAGNRFQILTMNADGSAMRAVTSRGLDERASYLPDGRILYYRGSSHVWVVANPDGTHIRSTAIQGPPWVASLCVLANGNRLAVRRSLKVNGPPLERPLRRAPLRGPGQPEEDHALPEDGRDRLFPRRHAHPFLVAVSARAHAEEVGERVFGAAGRQRSRAADTQPWGLGPQPRTLVVAGRDEDRLPPLRAQDLPVVRDERRRHGRDSDRSRSGVRGGLGQPSLTGARGGPR